MTNFAGQRGFSLMEAMLGALVSGILIAGVAQLVSGSVAAYRLQLGQGELEEGSRFARDMLIEHISQAGFQPEPWNGGQELAALTTESLEGGLPRGDQLGLQRWSRRNCYGNENPVTDAAGQPEFYLLRVRFSVNELDNLAVSCRYGPDASQLTTQINNYGLVEQVESMQVLYAEDRDGDALADAWVKAQAWRDQANIRAVRVALLLATRQPFDRPRDGLLTLLDEAVAAPADGRLRRVSTLTAAIRGRLQ